LAYDDLRDWIKTLEKHGELKRISEEVSPELEITEITDRMSKAGSRVAGSRVKGKGTGTGNYAPLRKHQRPSRPQGLHQPVRQRTPHGACPRR
jgi:hypothetical protein